MTKRDDSAFLRHIKDYSEEALTYCAGMSLEQFAKDRRTRWAVVKLVR